MGVSVGTGVSTGAAVGVAVGVGVAVATGVADGVGSGVRTGTGVAVGVGAGVTMPLGGAGVAGREYAMRCSLRNVDMRCREPVGWECSCRTRRFTSARSASVGWLRPMSSAARVAA